MRDAGQFADGIADDAVVVQHDVGQFKQAFAAGMTTADALRVAQVGERDDLHAFGARGEHEVDGDRVASGDGMDDEHVARAEIHAIGQHGAVAFQLLHAAGGGYRCAV